MKYIPKMTVTTVYENIDPEWLRWYLQRLANEQVLPGSTKIAAELKRTGKAVFESKDPESTVTGKTTYFIEMGDSPKPASRRANER